MTSRITRPPLLPLEALEYQSDTDKHRMRYEVQQNGKRWDGRGSQELRPISIETHYLHDSTGSAYFKIGNTKVLCGIYGPRPSSKSTFNERAIINLDFSIVPQMNKKDKMQESERHWISRLLLESLESVIFLERYPKSVIDINVIALEDDGGILSASLSCIGLALVDARIDVIDIIVGASIYAASSDERKDELPTFLVDADAMEKKLFGGTEQFSEFHIGLCLNRSGVCFLHAMGKHQSESTVGQLLRLAEATCRVIGNEIQHHLRGKGLAKPMQSAITTHDFALHGKTQPEDTAKSVSLDTHSALV